MKFAEGKRAVGICARSGRKMLLRDMVLDPRLKVLVDPAWADIKHPVEVPITAEDNQGLRRPAPDIDDDSPGAGGTLVATLFSGKQYFGGGT